MFGGQSIDISLSGLHNIVVGSDVNYPEKMPDNLGHLSAILADGTDHKRKNGKPPSVIAITNSGKVEPLQLRTFANTQGMDMECVVKDRLKQTTTAGITFIYDGAPVVDNLLSNIDQYQRCAWHGLCGSYHSLWDFKLLD